MAGDGTVREVNDKITKIKSFGVPVSGTPFFYLLEKGVGLHIFCNTIFYK